MNGLLGDHAAARRSVEDMLAAGLSGPLPDGSSSVEHAAALFRSMFSWTDVDELRSAAHDVRGFRGELRREFQAVATFAIGFAEFMGGDPENARAELQRAAELAADIGAWVIVTDALGFSAQVALMQGRAEDAEALARRSVDEARSHGLADLPHAGYYLATAGAALARSGRLEEGDQLLQTGIGQFADSSPLLAAHARLLRAPVRRQLGDMDGARALLEEARVLLAQCASTGIIGDLVPEVARALSASPRRGAELTDLTDRELSVLRLLEQGLSPDRQRALLVIPHGSLPRQVDLHPAGRHDPGTGDGAGSRTGTALNVGGAPRRPPQGNSPLSLGFAWPSRTASGCTAVAGPAARSRGPPAAWAA